MNLWLMGGPLHGPQSCREQQRDQPPGQHAEYPLQDRIMPRFHRMERMPDSSLAAANFVDLALDNIPFQRFQRQGNK